MKGSIAPHTNRSVVCSLKTFRLNGFNIKRFAHPYCLRVLFLGIRDAIGWCVTSKRLQRQREFCCVF